MTLTREAMTLLQHVWIQHHFVSIEVTADHSAAP